MKQSLIAVTLTCCSLLLDNQASAQKQNFEWTETVHKTDCPVRIGPPTSIDNVDSVFYALKKFYKSTNGGQWKNNTGWDTTSVPSSIYDFNQWYGLTVRYDNVIKMEFEGNDLSGEIPPEIGKLKNLKVLRLIGWSQFGGRDTQVLKGALPSELKKLDKLAVLRIEGHSITGSLPEKIWQWRDLQTLIIRNTRLSGPLFSQINVVGLSNLRCLIVEGNNFVGEIPSEIGNLQNLQVLWAGYNQLTGKIPPEIGNLTNLTSLIVDNNQLIGEIPSEIGNLTNLKNLWAGHNQLTGEIPSEIGNLRLLNTLNFGANQLMGEIPPEIGNLRLLNTLNFGANQLMGEIPPEIGNLNNIVNIEFSNNQLTGEIPSEIGKLTDLQVLWAGHNQLTGEIPPEIGNLQNLKWMTLGTNQLTGEIPSEIGKLKKMSTLLVEKNQLTGEIPNTFLRLGNLDVVALFDNNGLCIPNTDEFRTFVNNIRVIKHDGFCTTVSIEDQSELEDIQFYPNPASNSGIFTNLPYDAKIEVYDVLGRKVLTTDEARIDLSGLTSGLYIYTITSEVEKIKGKFVKQ